MSNLEMVRLANRAKDIGCYDAANVIFVELLRRVFSSESGLKIYIETQDFNGSDQDEAYFDLVVIREESGEDVCIPVPLLEQLTVIACYKQAMIRPDNGLEEKPEHNRKVRVAEFEETLPIWGEIRNNFASADLARAIVNTLAEFDGDKEPFAARLEQMVRVIIPEIPEVQ